jgi:hypothetical protein
MYLVNTIIILIEDDKWFRLERYARWKSRRLSLCYLPNDILEVIVLQLLEMDLQNFLHAILGFIPRLHERNEMLQVPLSIRSHWIGNVVLNSFKYHLSLMADPALFHCRDLSGSLIVADWSPFSSQKEFNPIADYSWTRSRPVRVNVSIYDEPIKKIINDCYQRQLCAVRLSLYTYISWNGVFSINPEPISWHLYNVFPPHVFL